MTISFSIVDIINFFFIAAGIGTCTLSFRHISVSSFLRKVIRRYFQIFFLVIILYIGTHLIRQILDGLSGDGVRICLTIVTFIEILAAGFMSFMMGILVIAAARVDRHVRLLHGILIALLAIHMVLLIINLFTGFIYYFDADNVYYRGNRYLLSNLAPIVIIIICAVLLVRYRKNLKKNVAIAFWVFTVTPIVAAGIQTFTYGVQFIILATVLSAVYMFETIIRDQTEQYEKQQLEASRLNTELSMATRIQADMLPNIFPAYPEREDFDIFASMTPAKEVGGDFYDFFFIDENHLGLVMADVSGKGVPAALFMMISKILVQNYALTGRSPKEVLACVNEQVCKNNREDMFVTIWFGILDLSTGFLTAANAGHEYPAVKQPNGSFELFHDQHSMVVGAMEGVRYKEYDMVFQPGAELFLYTDGVPEATNAANELYGTDRMLTALNQKDISTPEEALDTLNTSINRFVQDAPQFDDLTMLFFRYNGTRN